MNTKRILLFAIFLLLTTSAFPQGSLTPPPGAPTPTMKTLEQVEPRMDLNKLPGDATSVRLITAPGSYYLTADLSGAAAKDTINVVTAGHVTIDLNGFALLGTASGKSAINLPSGNSAVVIRNGVIRADTGSNTRAIRRSERGVVCENLTIVGNGSTSLELTDESVVARCRLTNGGILCGNRSAIRETEITIIDSPSSPVNVTVGDESQVVGLIFRTAFGELRAGERSLIADCQINVSRPFLAGGPAVTIGNGSVMRNCSIVGAPSEGHALQVFEGVLVSGCRITSVFRDGILGSANVTVEGCSVQGNGRDGIKLGAGARV